jgi:hypothetical protein
MFKSGLRLLPRESIQFRSFLVCTGSPFGTKGGDDSARVVRPQWLTSESILQAARTADPLVAANSPGCSNIAASRTGANSLSLAEKQMSRLQNGTDGAVFGLRACRVCLVTGMMTPERMALTCRDEPSSVCVRPLLLNK